jgi:ClpX C4-type zinc finger
VWHITVGATIYYTTPMYLRWQSRWQRHSRWGPGMYWSAVLVENKRVNGKPKQFHIAQLFGFSEGQIARLDCRRDIWDQVSDRLDRLGNRISAADRSRIEASIAEKLGPPPTQAEREELDRQLVEDRKEFARIAGVCCLFCGKGDVEVELLIHAAGHYICDQCVHRFYAVVAERRSAASK